MFARRAADGTWSVSAPAKLNLCLEILRRRDDGFHELETVMSPIRLHDRLIFQPNHAGQTSATSLEFKTHRLRLDAPLPPAGEDNLVLKALRRLAGFAGCEPSGRFTLAKAIPLAAGMGGGSSDAAAALVLANAAWQLNYPRTTLAAIAAEIGSDVPFFLADAPALCRGRGERVQAERGMPRLCAVVVKPDAGVSTPAAFAALGLPVESDQSRVPRSRGACAALLAAWRSGSWSALARTMVNDLQPPAERLCSAIAALHAAFSRLDVVAHALTGSGSAYFAVCRSWNHTLRIANQLRGRGLGAVYVTATC